MTAVPTIDLRSDTVTRPTPAMRRAMADAEVGDDVHDEDPTINHLQEVAAVRMGMEAGLFIPSGTMGNIIALKVHTTPGDEILLDGESHTMRYEVGSAATIANVQTRPYRSTGGVPDVDSIAELIQEPDLHAPGTSLIVLENTHNRAGGTVVPLDVHRAAYGLARERGVKVHIDGARIFNAAVASGASVAEYAARADSLTFCLSKGLGCPVGSVLCGSAEFIARARRVRKMLGGGMRQAGILAAAGLYALEHHVDRLSEDHANARRLAAAIAHAPGVSLEIAEPATNMLYFRTDVPAESFAALLKERGVLADVTARHRLRLVTHLDVSADDVDRAAAEICNVAAREL